MRSARGRRVVAAKAVVVQEEGPRRRHLVRLQWPPAFSTPRGGHLRVESVLTGPKVQREQICDAYRRGQACCNER